MYANEFKLWMTKKEIYKVKLPNKKNLPKI